METAEYIKAIDSAASFIKDKTNSFAPNIGIILGSGMGVLADSIENKIEIPYKEIPGFPIPTVSGHAGSLVLGTWFGKNVCVMKGRFHFYEGKTMQEVTFPVRVMKKLGAKTIILSNAAGGVNPNFKAGDFMLMKDHLNFTFQNPLMGPNLEEFGPRFPDSSEIYDHALLSLWKIAAQKENIPVHEGVYLFMTGPTYETPSEIKAAATLGADAVGMSTFPEALVAKHSGMKVAGMSYISNMGAGIGEGSLSHTEVIENMNRDRDVFIKLVGALVKAI